MYTAWTKHIKDEEEKREFETRIRNSRFVLDRLNQILAEEAEALGRSETSEKAFDNPNWAYLQAYKNGYRKALETVNKITDLDQQKVSKS